MLKLENTVLPSPEQWERIIMGMRNPMNSWARSDSEICETGIQPECSCCEGRHTGACTNGFVFGLNDLDLLKRLVDGGPVHAKFRRMIAVYVDVTAPLYWWSRSWLQCRPCMYRTPSTNTAAR